LQFYENSGKTGIAAGTCKGLIFPLRNGHVMAEKGISVKKYMIGLQGTVMLGCRERFQTVPYNPYIPTPHISHTCGKKHIDTPG